MKETETDKNTERQTLMDRNIMGYRGDREIERETERDRDGDREGQRDRADKER